MNGKQRAVKAPSPALVLEKKRMAPLFSACLSLLLLFFAAGFIIGYGGYFMNRPSVQTASFPPPVASRMAPVPVPKIQPRLAPIEEKATIKKADPVIPKIPEKTETAPVLKTYADLRPFTIRLASYRIKENALWGLAYFRKKEPPPYLVKIDWGQKGIWWSIYAGNYMTQEDAAAAKQSLNLKKAIIKEMPYANLIGVYAGESGTDEISIKIEAVTGVRPYTVIEADGRRHLFAGRFVTRESAEKLNTLLNENGIRAEVVKR